MPVIIKPVTSYQPRYPVVDVHSHAFKRPERLVGMAELYAPPNFAFPLYGHGSLEEAQATMAMTGIGRRVIKNLTSKPGGVPAANSFALSIARAHPELIPTGTVHPGYPNNEAEIDRLAAASIQGVAFDSCWQGFHIDDPRLRETYRKISAYRMFVLTHAGIDPKAPFTQVETWPEQVKRAKEMAPESLFIAAHLGANQAFHRAKEYVGTEGILFDLAWVAESCCIRKVTQEEILGIIDILGVERVVYGSDYPWGDPGAQLDFWEGLLPDDAWRLISHQNAERMLLKK